MIAGSHVTHSVIAFGPCTGCNTSNKLAAKFRYFDIFSRFKPCSTESLVFMDPYIVTSKLRKVC